MPEHDELELYEEPGLSEGDGRDWLRHQLAGWPYVPEALRRFLDALHWRHRAVVVLTFGEQMPQEQIAYRLGVTPRTVRRDLSDVCAIVEAKVNMAE